MMRGVCCWSRRRSRSAIRCCCWRAAERLGIRPAAAEAAEADGLLAIGERVTFRHQLVRSAVYRSAAGGGSPGGPSGVGGGNRSRTRPRPSGVASGRGNGGTRRGRSRRSSSALPAGRRRAAVWPLQPRSCNVRLHSRATRRRRVRQSPRGRRGERAGGHVRCGASGCWRRRRLGPLDELQEARVELLRGQHGVALHLRERRAAAAAQGGPTPRAARPRARSRHLPGRLGRGASCRAFTNARQPPRSLAGPRGPPAAARALRAHPMCCWTAWPRSSPRAEPPPQPLLEESTRTFADEEFPAEASLRWGWLTVVPDLRALG